MKNNTLQLRFKSGRAPNSDKARRQIYGPLSFLVRSISGPQLLPVSFGSLDHFP